ncbi:hypothetical protein [Variovorax ginsengisoli]|uniref:Uncharacterized protein n=1 Tax=Variovorax ginsengisoli TaxID=363844 RepID=A0ABT9S8G8_9BURK|nr:hypothetical protein [Variovorax ginsengisoli]MDP9899662.1 hypothetical protein [Variovorax ginsengisoli]
MASSLRWPHRGRSLGALLQTPAHRVVRVLYVTQSHWQLPERQRRGHRSPQAIPTQAVHSDGV